MYHHENEAPTLAVWLDGRENEWITSFGIGPEEEEKEEREESGKY